MPKEGERKKLYIVIVNRKIYKLILNVLENSWYYLQLFTMISHYDILKYRIKIIVMKEIKLFHLDFLKV